MSGTDDITFFGEDFTEAEWDAYHDEQESTMTPAQRIRSRNSREIRKAKDRSPTGRDQRVCVCGHPANRHELLEINILEKRAGNEFPQLEAQTHICKPSRMRCECLQFVAVLETSNTRYFIQKSTGNNSGHALVKGMRVAAAAALKDEKADRTPHTVTKLPDFSCACGATANLKVIGLASRGKAPFRPMTSFDYGRAYIEDSARDNGLGRTPMLTSLICGDCYQAMLDADRAQYGQPPQLSVVEE